MSYWPSTKAKRVFAAIQKIGWTLKAGKSGSHRQMEHPKYGEATFSFHDSDEIGPKMMGKVAKAFHLKREDL